MEVHVFCTSLAQSASQLPDHPLDKRGADIPFDQTGMSRGGNRHNVKPQVDEGLLVKPFNQQSELIKDLGSYEKISKTQASTLRG